MRDGEISRGFRHRFFFVAAAVAVEGELSVNGPYGMMYGSRGN